MKYMVNRFLIQIQNRVSVAIYCNRATGNRRTTSTVSTLLARFCIHRWPYVCLDHLCFIYFHWQSRFLSCFLHAVPVLRTDFCAIYDFRFLSPAQFSITLGSFVLFYALVHPDDIVGFVDCGISSSITVQCSLIMFLWIEPCKNNSVSQLGYHCTPLFIVSFFSSILYYYNLRKRKCIHCFASTERSPWENGGLMQASTSHRVPLMQDEISEFSKP